MMYSITCSTESRMMAKSLDVLTLTQSLKIKINKSAVNSKKIEKTSDIEEIAEYFSS